MNWSDDYCVGVREIDVQHRELFGLFREMQTALAVPDDHNGLRRTLQGLADYATYHFAAEEELLSGHPDLSLHEREHRHFMDRTRSFLRDFKAGRFEMSHDVFRFLSVWLKEHILAVDYLQLTRVRAARQGAMPPGTTRAP